VTIAYSDTNQNHDSHIPRSKDGPLRDHDCNRTATVAVPDNCGTARFGAPRDLPAKRVIVLTSPPAYRVPFSGWARSAAPSWWAVHNHLKPERLRHLPEATAETALDALFGALLAISTTPELLER